MTTIAAAPADKIPAAALAAAAYDHCFFDGFWPSVPGQSHRLAQWTVQGPSTDDPEGIATGATFVGRVPEGGDVLTVYRAARTRCVGSFLAAAAARSVTLAA